MLLRVHNLFLHALFLSLDNVLLQLLLNHLRRGFPVALNLSLLLILFIIKLNHLRLQQVALVSNRHGGHILDMPEFFSVQPLRPCLPSFLHKFHELLLLCLSFCFRT